MIRAARATGLRVAVFAQSIGPLSARGRRAVARALAGCRSPCATRPREALLAELGIDAPRFADWRSPCRSGACTGRRRAAGAARRRRGRARRPRGRRPRRPRGGPSGGRRPAPTRSRRRAEADAIAAAVPGVGAPLRRHRRRSPGALRRGRTWSSRCALHGLILAAPSRRRARRRGVRPEGRRLPGRKRRRGAAAPRGRGRARTPAREATRRTRRASTAARLRRRRGSTGSTPRSGAVRRPGGGSARRRATAGRRVA